MKYLPLIWAGLWRKPVRTTLTCFSIASVFLLFGSLYGVSAGFDAAIARVSANRLRVASSDGYRTLPLGYRQKIERVPGVATTMIATAISGYYQQPRNMLNIFAAGGDVRLEVFGEIKNTASHVAALRANRTGVLVGRQLAERFGWKVGDRVPVITGAPNRDGRNVLDFDIAGIYDVPTAPASANLFLINFDYLEEERIKGKGKTGMFFVDTVDPARNVEVSRAIDQLFINSEISTDTQTEREYQRTLITNALDVKLIVHTIVFASVFALLVLCGNTLMQSVRERIPEMAMLKTLGFSPTALVLLVLAEGVVLCTLAALLGLLASTLLFPTVALAVQVPALAMPLYVPVVGILVAVIAAVLSTAAPALRAGRLSIVDALAGR